MSFGARRPDSRRQLPRRARGFVGMVMLVILVVGALTYLVGGLSATDIKARQDAQTQQALKLAKEALIARAAVDENRPGTLPCPDRHEPTSENAGQADSMGTTCVNADMTQRQYFVGRFPWKTLGLEDLRDGYGERLWYALSPAFAHRNESDALINSDTQGQLTVRSSNGSEEPGVIAMVFSAGFPIGGQTRSDPLDPAQYLDQENGNTAGFTFAARRTITSPGQAGFPFNDRATLIRHDELFRLVENRVAQRLEGEIAPMLRDYRNAWSKVSQTMLPFAAAFQPGQPADSFCGTAGEPAGLLPVSSACLSWDNISVEVDDEEVTPSGCAAAPPKQPDKDRMVALVCAVNHQPGDKIEINARLRNTTKTLAVPVQTSKVKYGSFPGYTGIPPLLVSLSHNVKSGGHVEIRYRAFAWFAGTTTITLPVYSAATNYKAAAGKDPSWFFDNEWYRLTYYAAARAEMPNATGECVPGDLDPDKACLIVHGGAAPNDDKAAVLVLAGRALAGKTRPSTALTDYFEGENADGASAFEMRAASNTKSFNDKLKIVLPAP